METTLAGIATFPEHSRKQHLGPLLVGHVLAELAQPRRPGGDAAAMQRRALHMLAWFLAGAAAHYVHMCARSFRPISAI